MSKSIFAGAKQHVALATALVLSQQGKKYATGSVNALQTAHKGSWDATASSEDAMPTRVFVSSTPGNAILISVRTAQATCQPKQIIKNSRSEEFCVKTLKARGMVKADLP